MLNSASCKSFTSRGNAEGGMFSQLPVSVSMGSNFGPEETGGSGGATETGFGAGSRVSVTTGFMGCGMTGLTLGAGTTGATFFCGSGLRLWKTIFCPEGAMK